jgi:hypothetical protein
LRFHIRGGEWAVSTAAAVLEPTRFDAALVEELWRRNLLRYYKQHPAEVCNGLLEKLLYGPGGDSTDGGEGGEGSVGGEGGEGGAGAGRLRNARAKEHEFEEYAKFRFGMLAKSKQAAAHSKYAKAVVVGGDAFQGPAFEEDGAAAPAAAEQCPPRRIARHAEHAGFFDGLVGEQLGLIHGMNAHTAALFGGRPHGDGFSGALQRAMVLQALRFASNARMNQAVRSGEYLNTADYVPVSATSATSDASGSGSGPRGVAAVAAGLHAGFEKTRRECGAALAEAKSHLLRAKHVLLAAEPLTFAGRLMALCSTRGGGGFDALSALLSGGAVDGTPIPLLALKVRAVLTGCMPVGDGSQVVLSRGESWTTCPSDLATRYKSIVGEDEFVAIECAMHGSWGWVYRESDIANRHGHHNSNPNPDMGGAFTGFRL